MGKFINSVNFLIEKKIKIFFFTHNFHSDVDIFLWAIDRTRIQIHRCILVHFLKKKKKKKKSTTRNEIYNNEKVE